MECTIVIRNHKGEYKIFAGIILVGDVEDGKYQTGKGHRYDPFLLADWPVIGNNTVQCDLQYPHHSAIIVINLLPNSLVCM